MAVGDLVSRVYSGFRGADFRGEETSLVRSPDCLNVWKDYRETEGIRTRPEMELWEAFPGKVWGIFFYRADGTDMVLVHSGTVLYRVAGGERTELCSGLNEVRSSGFIFDTRFYFKDGIRYLQYDGSGVTEVEGYVPATSIGRKPEGGGSVKEDVNLLTGVRMNTFLGDGESTEYYLDAQGIDADYEVTVLVDDVPEEGFTVDAEAGKITFAAAPGAPGTDGQDNVAVRFRKTVEGYRQRIERCTLLQVFDNRVFFSGNPDFPNVVWHCSLKDPSYCSDLDYYNEGVDLSPVSGMAAGNNALWVMKEPSAGNTAVFYHNPTIDSEYGKIYPSTHSSVATGCVGGAVNFNDDICFFSERGMEGISGDVTTEQAVAHRSSLVDRRLLAEPGYRDMVLEEWEGYLLVFTGSHVYLADSRAMLENGSHAEYEWFYWELDRSVTCTGVSGGVLYLGTEDGIYTLTDREAPVRSWWTTPTDRFKHPQYLKTTNKRGCVAEAGGDITLYARTNGAEWEPAGTYSGISDYFTARVRRKKFKDIQLKFSSDTGFSLETATLECYIGGYIKR